MFPSLFTCTATSNLPVPVHRNRGILRSLITNTFVTFLALLPIDFLETSSLRSWTEERCYRSQKQGTGSIPRGRTCTCGSVHPRSNANPQSNHCTTWPGSWNGMQATLVVIWFLIAFVSSCRCYFQHDQSQQTKTVQWANRSEYQVNACSRRKAGENTRVQVAIGFGFASHWLKM